MDHAARRRAGLFADDQDAVTFGPQLEETPPDPIGVPRRVRDELLKGLVDNRVRDPGHHGLHPLPIAVDEEAMHVGRRSATGCARWPKQR